MTDRPWGAFTKHNHHVDSELLTPKECAAYRRCSVRKLDRERAEGRGCPYVRVDARIFYRRPDIDQFIAAHVRGVHDADVANEFASGRRNRSRKGAEVAAKEYDPPAVEHPPIATKPVRR
jgi:hypothetical protein